MSYTPKTTNPTTTNPSPTTGHRATRTRRGRRLGVAVLATMAGLGALGIGAPAQADDTTHNRGVDWASFSATDLLECVEGQDLPCPHPGADGASGTVYVSQSLVDGEWVYDTITTGDSDDSRIWFHTNVAGDCRAGYEIYDVSVGMSADATIADNLPEEFGQYPQAVSGPLDQNSFPSQDVIYRPTLDSLALHVPALDAYALPVEDAIFALGEQMVADQLAAGADPETVRLTDYYYQHGVHLYGKVACDWSDGVPWAYSKAPTDEAMIRLLFLGADPEPGVIDQYPIPDDFELGAAVVQAELAVIEDQEACVIHASATFVTNQPTTIQYRVADDFGQRSRLFTVEVGEDLTAFVSHEVAVPQSPDVTGGLAPAPEPGRDPGEDLVAQPSDNVTGVLHIEIEAPHAFESDYGGFSMEPCTPEVDPVRTELPEAPVQLAPSTQPEPPVR